MVEAAPGAGHGALVGVDVGGTFTDAVVLAGGRLTTAKVPTTPDDQSEDVVRAVLLALERAGLAPGEVTRFSHGMTVGTNALLEGKGARTALVATEGFGDLLELRRQTRAHLYRLDAHHPPPLVPAERVVEARERCTPDGVEIPLGEDAVAAAVAGVRATGAEAVAVGLLFSYAHPEHERRLAAALREALPDVHVSASHRGAPRDPRVRAALDHRGRRLPDPRPAPLPAPIGAPGRGGRAAGAGDHAVQRRDALHRGVRGPRRLDRPERARRRGDRRRPPRRALRRRARPDLRHGRHLVRRRAGRGRCAGPHLRDDHRAATPSTCRCSTSRRSRPAAAASPGPTRAEPCASGPTRPVRAPGPVCYGLGGTEADRDRREPGARPPGRRRPPRRRDPPGPRSRPRSARRLGARMEPPRDADDAARGGCGRVVQASMERALRVVSVERGVDPRVAARSSRSAGPVPCTPANWPTRSAPPRYPYSSRQGCCRPSGWPWPTPAAVRAGAVLGRSRSGPGRGAAGTRGGGPARDARRRHPHPRTLAVRYAGQREADIPVATVPPDPDPRAAFESAHEAAYGYRDAARSDRGRLAARIASHARSVTGELSLPAAVFDEPVTGPGGFLTARAPPSWFSPAGPVPPMRRAPWCSTREASG